MPAGSKTDPPLAKAESVSDSDVINKADCRLRIPQKPWQLKETRSRRKEEVKTIPALEKEMVWLTNTISLQADKKPIFT
ncbi:hypothetical protein GRJ2_003467300 [Grus japonensis]|uniref:Uncharacterized protein n=1 Tax=Grus japonensis TaxID=30415 RepID=A0ABC9YKT9_GRUJA